jgi:Spy/CpxP family protein refolding chaperone
MYLRTKIIRAGLVVGLLTAFGPLVPAQQPSTQTTTTQTPESRMERRRERRGFRRGPGQGRMGHGALSELNLSDAQKQQIRAIMEQGQGNKTLRQEMRQLGEKRRQGTLSAEDQARVLALREQMRSAMKDRRTKLEAVLTAEQKTKLESLRKERRANGERFGGKRRGFRGKPGQSNPQMQSPSKPPSNP